MMIEPKQSDIGREVIYRVHSNAEAGGGFGLGSKLRWRAVRALFV